MRNSAFIPSKRPQDRPKTPQDFLGSPPLTPGEHRAEQNVREMSGKCVSKMSGWVSGARGICVWIAISFPRGPLGIFLWISIHFPVGKPGCSIDGSRHARFPEVFPGSSCTRTAPGANKMSGKCPGHVFLKCPGGVREMPGTWQRGHHGKILGGSQ